MARVRHGPQTFSVTHIPASAHPWQASFGSSAASSVPLMSRTQLTPATSLRSKLLAALHHPPAAIESGSRSAARLFLRGPALLLTDSKSRMIENMTGFANKVPASEHRSLLQTQARTERTATDWDRAPRECQPVPGLGDAQRHPHRLLRAALQCSVGKWEKPFKAESQTSSRAEHPTKLQANHSEIGITVVTTGCTTRVIRTVAHLPPVRIVRGISGCQCLCPSAPEKPRNGQNCPASLPEEGRSLPNSESGPKVPGSLLPRLQHQQTYSLSYLSVRSPKCVDVWAVLLAAGRLFCTYLVLHSTSNLSHHSRQTALST